jgi:purine-nucleoside phosphorylase
MTELELRLPDALGQARGRARSALVLGSGFGGLADGIEGVEAFDYDALEGFPHPRTRVAGHAGRLLLGSVAGVPVVVFAGRVHMYQGLSALEAAWTARMAHALGCETLVLTNAAGGVSLSLAPGDVVLIEDHINLTGRTPLDGWAGPVGGVPFVPMGGAYDVGLQDVAVKVAAEHGIELARGVYAGLLGPSFETRAEVRMLRTLGADVVGMSTVVETIAARALGVKVLGFSLVANIAAGSGLDHEEVLETGRRAQAQLTVLLTSLIGRL